MKFKIVNSKSADYIIIEGENIEEIRKQAHEEQEKRGWDTKDMCSVELD